jgi:hypothetical protein
MIFTVREMRWLALLAITVAIGQSRITGHALELRLGSSSLVPVPSAFETWEAILVVFAGCLVYELFRNRHGVAASDRVSPLVVASGVLASLLLVWNLWMTMVVSVALAIVATVAYIQVHRAISEGLAPRWLGVPFALLLGFVTVIAICAIDVVVGPGPIPAICLVAVASMGTIWLGVNARDAVLPGLVGWLMTQISAYDHSVLAGALIGGGACAGVALFLVFSSQPGSPPTRAVLR